MNGLHPTRRAAVLGGVVVAAVATGLTVTALTGGFARSQGGPNPAADFTKITPSPYYITTPTFPDYSNPPHCQFPDNERPSPDLPPLSCRYSSAEPTPGAIPTVDPAVKHLAVAALAGFQIVDNQLFRFTVQFPDTWHSDMRPEGGASHIDDPIATREAATQKPVPGGGVTLYFSASAYFPPRVPDGFQPGVEVKLKTPNASFGGVPGVIWDDGPGEGYARGFRAAFLKDGIVYSVDAAIEGDGRSDAEIQFDIDAVNAILATIMPY